MSVYVLALFSESGIMAQLEKLEEQDMMRIINDLSPEDAESIGLGCLGVKVKVTAGFIIQKTKLKFDQ